MRIKKDLVIVALITFFLTTTLFMIRPTKSDFGPGEYNPWADIDDNGIVDIYDAIRLANAFGLTGDPGNKTELLYNASKTFSEAYLTTRINTLEATVAQQQSTIADLETELAVLNATKLGQPDYDSGWFQLNKSQSIILVHNLNTTDVMCYMMGNDTDGNFYTHQIAYGGDNYVGGAMGVYWAELTSATVKVTRANGDNYWDNVRFLIWKVYK
jgi:hypothetical protein